jgi:hypothetical protein
VIPLLADGAARSRGVSWEQAGASGDRKRYRLDHTWDLGKMAGANLKPGDVLEYFVQVKDNFRLNGREHDFVPSGKLRITIISDAAWAERVRQDVEQIGSELRQVKQGQARTKVETGELAKAATERAKFDEADKAAAERLANQQGTTAAQTMQTAQKLQDLVRRMAENKSPESGVKQTAAEVAERLNKLADGEMREAGRELNEAKDQKPTDPQGPRRPAEAGSRATAGNLEKAGEQQAASEQKLQAAMDKLGDFSTLGDMVAKLEDIKKQQKEIGERFNKNAKDNLGKHPEDMSKEAREQNEQLGKEQDASRRRPSRCSRTWTRSPTT